MIDRLKKPYYLRSVVKELRLRNIKNGDGQGGGVKLLNLNIQTHRFGSSGGENLILLAGILIFIFDKKELICF